MGDGYGHVRAEGRNHYVHRLVCEFFHGRAPFARAEALHSCDTPACYEPTHLRWGTHADNMRDAARKGRNARGERHGRRRLTLGQVRAIRLRWSAGEKQMDLHREYGISRSQVSRICLGQRWPEAQGEATNV